MRLRIPELDELHPLRWLDDDVLHERPAGSTVRWYAPDGTPLPGDLRQQMDAMARHKCEPGNLVRTEIGLEGRDNIAVSTVYLGLDHGYPFYGTSGPPIIWETMIFYGSWEDQYQWRYATRNAAMANHRTVVEIICRTMGADVVDEVDRPPGSRTV